MQNIEKSNPEARPSNEKGEVTYVASLISKIGEISDSTLGFPLEKRDLREVGWFFDEFNKNQKIRAMNPEDNKYVDIQPEEYPGIVRCAKSFRDFYILDPNKQRMFDNSMREQFGAELYDVAEPYNINLEVIDRGKYGKNRSNPPIPSTKEYFEWFPFADAEHLNPPAATMAVDSLVGYDKKDRLKLIADSYFTRMEESKRVLVADRLDRMRANDGEGGGESTEVSCTVCIPVAILGETEGTIRQALEALASQTETNEFEVILYANYIEEDASEQAIIDKQEMLSKLVSEYSASNKFRLRFLLEGYDKSTISISRIRKDYMDMMALDSVEQGRGSDHLVLWLDADTTKASKQLVDDHIKFHQKNNRSIGFAGSNILFDMSTDDESEKSDGRKLASYAELQRRKHSRKLRDRRYEYMEECGLSFKLGDYLFIGGVNAADSLNETTWLGYNAFAYAHSAKRVLGEGDGHYGFTSLRTARVYSSGRRQVAGANQLLQDGYLPSEDYLYFVHGRDEFTHSDNDIRLGTRGVNTKDAPRDETDAHAKIIDRRYEAFPQERRRERVLGHLGLR